MFVNLEEGELFNFDVTGDVNQSTTLTGNISLTNKEKEVIDGVLVTPRVQAIQLTATSSNGTNSFSETTIDYLDEDFNTIKKVDNESITCTVTDPGQTIPDKLELYDLYTLGTKTCSDSTTTKETLELLPFNETDTSKAIMHFQEVTRNVNSEIVGFTSVFFTIDDQENFISIKLKITEGETKTTLTSNAALDSQSLVLR